MKKRIFSAVIITIILLFTASCAKQNDDIIKYYKTADEASKACGLPTFDYVPDGYEALSYNSVYGFVFEAHFKKTGNYTPSENSMAGIAVLRIADAEYNISNLSGFSDAKYAGIYDDRIDIKAKDGIYMAEWKEKIADKEYNIAYTIFGDTIYSSDEGFEQYKKEIAKLILYLEK